MEPCYCDLCGCHCVELDGCDDCELLHPDVLAAGYVWDLLFCTQNALEIYFYKLDRDYSEYKILDRFDREDGSVIVRILQQYNNSSLINLYDNV